MEGRLVDESSVVFSQGLSEIVQNTHNIPDDLSVIPPFSEESGLPVMAVHLGARGWDALRDPNTLRLLQDIHHTIEDQYQWIHNIISSGYAPNRDWEDVDRRAFMRPQYEINDITLAQLSDHLRDTGMNGQSLSSVLHFFQSVNPRLIDNINRRRVQNGGVDRKTLTHLFPLAGPCYSTAIVEKQSGEAIVAIRPYVFSDLGGAGLTFMHNQHQDEWVTVKSKKGVGVFTDEEIAQRQAFQQGFLSYSQSM